MAHFKKKRNGPARSHGVCLQRDQIGLLLKGLGYIFSYKNKPKYLQRRNSIKLAIFVFHSDLVTSST